MLESQAVEFPIWYPCQIVGTEEKYVTRGIWVFHKMIVYLKINKCDTYVYTKIALTDTITMTS